MVFPVLNKFVNMNIYKTLFFVVVLGICSCNYNKDAELKEYANNQSEERIRQRLYALGEKYENKVLLCQGENPIIPRRKTEGPTELTSEEKLRVAKADMEGFAMGAALGGAIGGAVGSIVPAAGNGVGIFVGGAAAGAAYAAVWSKNEANAIKEEKEGGQDAISDLYLLDFNDPIVDFACSNLYFDSTIMYANVGFLHNVILSEFYCQDTMNFFCENDVEMVDFIFNNIYTPLHGCEVDHSFLYTEVSTNVSDDYLNSSGNDISIDYDEMVQIYLGEIEHLPEYLWLSYTREFMQIIDEELRGIDEQRVLIINGCISTFLYSRCFWNTNIPSYCVGTCLIYNLQEGTWDTANLETINDLYLDFITNGTEFLILVPRYSNGQLESMFVFDDLSTIDKLQDVQYLIRSESDIYIYCPSDEDLDVPNANSTTIPAGTYILQRFDYGYFIEL